MVRFPSDEWAKMFKDELNKNTTYAEAAKDWEGDFLFVIAPDEGFPHETVVYVDLWHGKCRDAYLVRGEKKAKFVLKGPYSHWKKVINKELDPLRGLIRGMFTVEGDSKMILEQAKAAQELVNTASKIPVDFING
ncbi:MAG: SCP2 sterol-binding domain-containing protein [Candidatus Thermoplasmatota archaeon]|nr:SCP2 sterol-binding domain-containing protein [Candidatus Thermoplasmatota archaeon]